MIWEIAAVAAFMAVLISANGMGAFTQKQRGQKVTEDRTEQAVDEAEENKTSGETEQAGAEKAENDIWPLPAEIPGEKRIELVFCSEGCYCYYNGSLYGYMTKTGEEITPCMYEEAAPFSEGLALFCVDGQYGYMDRSGRIVTGPVYVSVQQGNMDIWTERIFQKRFRLCIISCLLLPGAGRL